MTPWSTQFACCATWLTVFRCAVVRWVWRGPTTSVLPALSQALLVPLTSSACPRQAEAHSYMLYRASTFGLRGPLGPLGTLVVGPRSRKRPQHRRRLRHGDSPLEPTTPCRGCRSRALRARLHFSAAATDHPVDFSGAARAVSAKKRREGA